MGKKYLFLIFTAIFILTGINSFAQQSLSFSELIEQGYHEFQKKNYDKANLYFELAHQLDPKSPKPIKYLALIAKKTVKKQRLIKVTKEEKLREDSNEIITKSPSASQQIATTKKSNNVVSQTEPKIAKQVKTVDPNSLATDKPLILSNDLKTKNPTLSFSLTIRKKLIIESQNIKNFLVVKPDIFDVKRINTKQIELTALRLGSSVLYVWDDSGRWVLDFNIVLPTEISLQINQAQKPEERITYRKNFKFGFTNAWSTNYRGDSLSNLKKTSSQNMTPTYNILGDTPYGVVSGFASYIKFPEKLVLTSYGVGLSQINNFLVNDYSIQGFDTSASLSSLSLPGESFRGVSTEGKTLNRKLKFLVFHGQDRATFGFTSSGQSSLERSFIEGFQILLFPDWKDQIAFNVARGFGQSRNPTLKKKAFAITTSHRHSFLNFNSEVGYDTDTFATFLSANKNFGKNSVSSTFRSIDNDYQSVSGKPSHLGEIGSTWNYSTRNDIFSYNAFIDFYRTKDIEIAPDPDKFNYDLTNGITIPLPKKYNLTINANYTFTPAFLSPTRTFSINSSLSKSFKILSKTIYSSLSFDFNRRKNITNIDQNTNRYSIISTFQIPIINKLYYQLTNNYSILTQESTGETAYPFYTTMGLSYSADLNKKLSNSLNINYRKEGQSTGELSYLSGEDSYDCNYSLDYKYQEDSTLFFSTHYRSVWAKTRENQSYNEVGFNVGVHSNWNLPIRWDYKGILLGVVYKDLNHNNKFDEGEPGIPTIKIHIGDNKYLTDSKGRYFARIFAQSVTISLDFNDIPKGYTLGTTGTKKIDIKKEPTTIMNFALSTQSSVSGIVYVDANGNGKIDANEETIPNIKLSINNKFFTSTDRSGNYFLGNLMPGKQIFRVDVNSIPREYMPVGKVRQELNLPESGSMSIQVPLKKRQ